MRFLLITLISLCSSYITFGQNSADIQLELIEENEEYSCYHLILDYVGEATALASQNYRLFYDASAGHFLEDSSALLLPTDMYTYNIVQHLRGLDASGMGEIPFESSLGFINAAIILNDVRAGGQKLNEQSSRQPIASFCFMKTRDSITPMQIILARESATSSYGRAFIEIAQLSGSGQLSSLPIRSYKDFLD